MKTSVICSVIAAICVIFVCGTKADGLYDNYLGNVHAVSLAYPVPQPINAPLQGFGSMGGMNLQSDQSLLSKHV